MYFIISCVKNACVFVCMCCVFKKFLEDCMRNCKTGYLITSGCWDESLWVCDFTFYPLIVFHSTLCMSFKKKTTLEPLAILKEIHLDFCLSCNLHVLVWISRLWGLLWPEKISICKCNFLFLAIWRRIFSVASQTLYLNHQQYFFFN